MKTVKANRVISRIENLEPRTLFSTYIVNTVSDSPSPGAGLTSLREAVNLANAHGGSNSIQFSSLFSTAKTINLSNGFMPIYNTLSIAGPGSSKLTIDAHQSERVFDVESGANVTVSGITFANGEAPHLHQSLGAGGAILNYGTSLTVNNCVFNHDIVNTLSDPYNEGGAGGAIYSAGALTVNGSTFTGNTVNANESTLVGQGGAIWCSGTLAINSSTFSSNIALGGSDPAAGTGGAADGGAVYATGKLSVNSSTFSKNTAQGGVGFSGGSASGGAIYSTNADTIINSTITGNNAIGANAGGNGNNGGGFGGGICSISTLSITTSKITSNKASSGFDAVEFPTTLNQQSAAGGGIFCKGNMTLTQSTVSGNTAQGGAGLDSGIAGAGAQGGGLFVKGTLTVSRSSIFSNQAIGGTGNPANVGPNLTAGNGGDAQGGGVWAGSTSLFTNSTIANNTAKGGHGGDTNIDGAPSGTGAGAGGSAYGGGIFSNAALTLRDATVAGNIVTAGTGGAGFSGPPVVKTGKAGAALGGGIYSYADSALITNTIVSANTANGVFADIAGKTLSASSQYNLIGAGGGLTNGVHGNKVGITNPKLSPLQNNGGPTLTLLPLTGSAAINAGSNALIPAGTTTDQRGDARIVGNVVDIGAVET